MYIILRLNQMPSPATFNLFNKCIILLLLFRMKLVNKFIKIYTMLTIVTVCHRTLLHILITTIELKNIKCKVQNRQQFYIYKRHHNLSIVITLMIIT